MISQLIKVTIIKNLHNTANDNLDCYGPRGILRGEFNDSVQIRKFGNPGNQRGKQNEGSLAHLFERSLLQCLLFLYGPLFVLQSEY